MSIKVTSHVGRDLLQSSTLFKNEAAVVWEYVVNSLQYVDAGILPTIQVEYERKNGVIRIIDNGSGMNREGLNHFFTMHGENVARKGGRPGRGMFGTGKSAAFGIGNKLKVDTVKNGIQNALELSRNEIVKAADGGDIPIRDIIVDVPSTKPNGTIVEISDLNVKIINLKSVIEYIERHLSAFKQIRPQVAVNEHVCEYIEPEIAASYNFKPNAEDAIILGDIVFNAYVSKAPLPLREAAVFVYTAPGVLVGIEKGGIENKEMANYIFGEVETPSIETFNTEIAPYNPTRDLTLNPQHPVVNILQPFIGKNLEIVRKELVQQLQEARKTEEAKRLSELSNRMADIINEDFASIERRLLTIKSRVSQPYDAKATYGGSGLSGDEDETYIEGTQVNGLVQTKDSPKEATSKQNSKPPPDIPKAGKPDDLGDDKIDPVGGEGKKRRPRGGFNVEYRPLGQDSRRSQFVQEERLILINLDHPIINAAKDKYGSGSETFIHITYDIAFSEYAIALVTDMALDDPGMPADEGMYEIRDILDRVSRLAAKVYDK